MSEARVCFIRGIELVEPALAEEGLREVVSVVAPGFPLDLRLPEIMAEYQKIWQSHRIIAIQPRRASGMSFNQSAGASCSRLAGEPLSALPDIRTLRKG